MKATATENTPAPSSSAPFVPWVEQARSGDRQSFHRLADHFQPEIFRMIYYRTRSKMDAEDLTQDVFLKAFKNLNQLESPQQFRSWLYQIAINRVRDHHRRQRVKALLGMVSMDEEEFQETEEMAVAPEAADQLARKDFWRRVHVMLDRLSRMEREVFTLRFLDQLSLKEISETMKRDESTVKTHLYRALAKMKTAAQADRLWEGI
ncbi:MAG: RNA polymerase sigma factor [Desulfobacteraceae bacterium]|nr:RNA polymerase sigma factor [Desulfobacteraceae bacterium]